ncbi:hypothetical protein N7520_003263 [Penicillium odoratum]|uniref:uncharacterized protein n=1 Tax=Penicillium odoratum TaxID=1167516 RepID=UPI002549976C|nr:uncharacterized protein N7520_003263 [Penicillium odoratum]KAJ5768704.1 hypothetical protein N7520_003263 [Penicillium odoratum]
MDCSDASRIARKEVSKQQTAKPPVVPPDGFGNYIRDDFVFFIQENLPYWKINGLFDTSALSNPNCGGSGYESLKNIYSCMCELDLRIDHDQIRKRAALVLLDAKYKEALADWDSQKEPQWSKDSVGVGRGDSSGMIDNMLGRMHPDWNSYDARRRSKLRAKFHNEKRHGKRWAVLVAGLGPSILFLCSSQLVRTVYVVASLERKTPRLRIPTDFMIRKDTTITITTLEQIATNCILTLPCAMRLLQLMNPIAQALLYNWDCRSVDTKSVLGQLHVWQETRSTIS